MKMKSGWGADKLGLVALAAVTLGATYAIAGNGADDALAAWLGQEITLNGTAQDPFPAGGKLSLIYDAKENLVHVCTRPVATQLKPWLNELASPCAVTLTFTRGTRYCTEAEVKTGDSELLASCHRLRGREIAMQVSTAKTVERNDILIFLVKGAQGTHDITILVDSPSRVTVGTTQGGAGDNGGGNGGSSGGG